MKIMKKIIIITFLFMCGANISAQTIELKERLIYKQNLAEIDMLSDYIRFWPYENKIFINQDTSNGSANIIVEEEFRIHEVHVNSNYSLIAYRYGTGNFSIPAVYDYVSRTKVVLDLFLKESGDKYVYEIVDNLNWLDSRNLVFSVYDPRTGYSLAKTYNLDSETIDYLFSGINLKIIDINPNLPIILYSTGDRSTRRFWIYNYLTAVTNEVLSSDYDLMYIVNSNTLLGFKPRRQDNPPELIIIRENKVIYKTKDYEILGIYTYKHEAQMLIAKTTNNALSTNRYVDLFKISLE